MKKTKEKVEVKKRTGNVSSPTGEELESQLVVGLMYCTKFHNDFLFLSKTMTEEMCY